MLRWMIDASLANRAVVLALFLVVTLAGVQTATRLPVEVLPDLTRPTVLILTEAPGLAPEEVEAQVTLPIENALGGMPGLTRLRSNSDIGLSLVYAEFGWKEEIYRARMLVSERLAGVDDELSQGVEPFMTPVASLMGEILLVGVRSTVPEGAPGHLAPAELRTIADRQIRRRLLGIPGVAEVLNMGGGVRRIEIRPDPQRLRAYGITLGELEAAARSAASTTTGGFLSSGSSETMVRHLAMSADPESLAATAVRRVNGHPVLIRDLAEVVEATAPMRGDAAVRVAPEPRSVPGVILSVTKSPGFDTRSLTAAVEAALEELGPSLPAGLEVTPLFAQKSFIDRAIGNLLDAMRDGAVMVVLVLFLFLLNLRTTFITLTAMPTSFAITLLTFRYFDISVNSMTLGGLAVAVGMVVDDAIVDVENVYRRLRENAGRVKPRPRLAVIAEASGEVRHSIFYATLLVILVFLPLLALSGVEGKLFAPIAIATIVAMIASFVVSMTLIPVLCSLLLHPRSGREHRDGMLVRFMKGVLERTLLRAALGAPLFVLAAAAIVLAGALALYPAMKHDFLPRFQEETALVAATAAPGTSLEEMNRLSQALEAAIFAVPEVHKVGRRLGRAERGDHVVPLSTVEFDIDFYQPEGVPERDRSAVLDDLGRRIRSVPGIFAVVSGPLADRIGHMMSGVSAPVAIKIFGPDPEQLRAVGVRVQQLARTIPGLERARLDVTSPVTQLRIEPDRERLAAYGMTPGQLNETLATLIGGREVARLRDGEYPLSLVLRLPPEWRESPERIGEIPIAVSEDESLPLARLARIREAKGPNVIFRENGRRRFVVAIQPTASDVPALVERLEKRVREEIALPEGVLLSFEGEFEARREATVRIAIASVLVVIAIFMMLYRYFRSVSLALQVLVNIPLALIGGLILTRLTLNNVSMATLIGLIAVGGVAARNGIMMIAHYLHLIEHEGEVFGRAMIVRGTLERLVPVTMTALAAGIGLLPLVFGGDQPGREILHPVAIVIVGGLISSTLLDMVVTPAMFRLFGRKAAERALARRETRETARASASAGAGPSAYAPVAK